MSIAKKIYLKKTRPIGRCQGAVTLTLDKPTPKKMGVFHLGSTQISHQIL